MAALLIVAHAPLASALAHVARHTGLNPDAVIEAFDVPPALSRLEDVRDHVEALLQRMPQREVLVLTDVFAATPCNGSLLATARGGVRVVTGVNVPMLWKVVSHIDEPLARLVEAAVSAGQQGVMQLSTAPPQEQARRVPSHDPAHARHQQ
jgi:PTS system ascorbate-specific IIA component